MLLNQWGQPTLIGREEFPENINDLVSAPLLLCHKDGLFGNKLPLNWCGCLYKSELISDEYIQEKISSNGSYSIVNLVANKTVDVTLPSDSVVQLTLLPLDANNTNFMFIIKDPHVTSVVTDNFTPATFKAFLDNKLLGKMIADEIDVLYINDKVFEQQPPVMRTYPSELLLRSLATLLQPRYILGIGKNELPPYLLRIANSISSYGQNKREI